MRLVSTAVAATFLCAAATAGAVTIDFEGYAPGTSITNQYAALGVTFATSDGVSVENAAISRYFIEGTFTNSLTNSLDGENVRRQFLTINFAHGSSGVSFGYDNYGEFLSGDNFKAYDGSGTLIETLSPSSASYSALETISFSTTGIRRITLEQPTSGWIFAIDNLNFTATVPEPGSWVMLIAGFGLVGAALRRRRGEALPA